MPRIRSIKPEILEDDKTASLESREWRAFVSLICLADDRGHVRANPRWLEGQIFWGTREEVNIRAILARLSRENLITLYSHSGQPYLRVTNWDRHQKVDHPAKPRMPQVEDDDGSVDFATTLGTPLFRESLGKSSRLIQDQGSRIKDLGSRTKDPDGPREGSAPWSGGPITTMAELELAVASWRWTAAELHPSKVRSRAHRILKAGAIAEHEWEHGRRTTEENVVAGDGSRRVPYFLGVVEGERERAQAEASRGSPPPAGERAASVRLSPLQAAHQRTAERLQREAAEEMAGAAAPKGLLP
jgi:hypothetical protein